MTRILVVEDEESLRSTIVRVLREQGHKVDEAGDGEEGLDLLKSSGGDYALVICDVTMPVLDGISMLEAAGDSLGSARVLFISGYALEVPDLKGRRYSTLRKPVPSSQVVDVVGELLAA